MDLVPVPPAMGQHQKHMSMRDMPPPEKSLFAAMFLKQEQLAWHVGPNLARVRPISADKGDGRFGEPVGGVAHPPHPLLSHHPVTPAALPTRAQQAP